MSIKKLGINILSLSIGAIGIVSSLVTSFWPTESLISIRVLNAVIFFGLLIIMFIGKWCGEQYQENLELKGKLKELKEENDIIKNNPLYAIPFNFFNPRGNDTNVLLIRNNINFRNGTFVSIYNKTDSSEELAYIGSILNIQSDNCYQIQILKANIGYENFEINTNTIKNFIVHPSIPSNFMELLKND